jgi:hypothetical protein
MGRPLVSLTTTRQSVKRNPVEPRHMAHSRSLSGLPCWRGFALQDLDTATGPYTESDFQTIAAYGFNFVRLALGYQYITIPVTVGTGGAASGATTIPVTSLTTAIASGVTLVFGVSTASVAAILTAPANQGDTSIAVAAIPGAIPAGAVSYSILNPTVLGYIDQAIGWCISLGIHAMLDMHETPGYSVLNPNQTPSFWTDGGLMYVLESYWATFAARYIGISNMQLSFNLLNEPEGINHVNYSGVMKLIINAIRAVDPTRLIFCDGMPTALVPSQELIGTGVAQAYHGLYTPMSLSHYGADWLTNWWEYALPAWPDTLFVNQLYGNDYPDYQLPIEVVGNFSVGDTISLNIAQCNIRAQYQIWDVTNNILLADTGLLTMTSSGPGTPYEDPIWHVWSNINLGVVATGTVTEVTTQLEIRVPNGNWSTIANITTYNHGNTAVITPNTTEMAGYYGLPATTLTLDNEGNYVPADSNWNIDTIRELVKAWSDLLAKRGIDIMNTEGGVFHTVPPSIALASLSDHLTVLKEFGIGFTIWNLRGNFGPFDSGRNMAGICNVAADGVTVTYVSGSATGMGTQTAFFYFPPGTAIAINGVSNTIASVANGRINSVSMANQGSNYTAATTVTFSGGGGAGATGTPVISSGHITGVTITNPGAGYTSKPSVSFADTGGGAGAAGTVNATLALSQLTLANSVGQQTGVAFSITTCDYETVTFPDESVHYLDTAMMAILQAN